MIRGALVALLVTLLPIGPPPARGGDEPARATPYEHALELYRAGELQRAAELLERADDAGAARAGELSLLGWCRLRLGQVDEARGAFERALADSPGAPDPTTGLGYTRLRSGDPAAAEASFRAALDVAPDSADALKGLAYALGATGDHKGAREALQRAVRVAPDDREARELLDANLQLVVEERRPRPPVDPATPLQVVARAHAARFEIPAGADWRPLFIAGVNLGTALPGRFPAEFPDDETLYRTWFDEMGQAGINVVRLYTLHPPSLYRALAAHNRAHADRPLWLIQGAWTELPPGDLYDDPEFDGQFRAEIRRVVDAVHGNLEQPPRPGHAGGIYDADVSTHTLAFLLGREWEPFSVDAYDRHHPDRTSFDGEFVTARGRLAIEAWLASICDEAVAHETRMYRQQHPVGYTSWPTLDPLVHPTEATVAEETAIRGRHGDLSEDAIREYDNDLVQLDATLMQATDAFPAGLFAAYHAYPYYPDFMLLDPDYAKVDDGEGVSRYLGYLRDLARHHGDQPVLIAEFGVPSSRGIAHLQPEGQHHGGHDEVAQGEIDARLLRDIHRAGLAGGVVFAWIDEWFKHNWVVMAYESPRERNPLWLNALDAEQNFGLIAAQPGDPGPPVILDGRLDDWRGVEPVYERDPTSVPPGGVTRLRVTSDAAYLYLALETRPAAGALRRLVGIDTYDPRRGSRRFPAPAARPTSIGMEFVLELAGAKDSRLRVERGYDLFSNRLRRPYASTPNDAGDFIDIHVWTNRDRYGRDGTYYRAKGYDRSPLRRGTTDPAAADFDSLADFDSDEATGAIEVRLPWGLLNVADPSSRRVIHETSATEGPVQTTPTEGFRFHLLTVRDDDQARVVDEWPPAGSDVDDHPVYAWPTWDTPAWHLRPKRSLAIFGETIRRLSADPPAENPENRE